MTGAEEMHGRRLIGLVGLVALTACGRPPSASAGLSAAAVRPFTALCQGQLPAGDPGAAKVAATVKAMRAVVAETDCAAADAKLALLSSLALAEVADLRPLAGFTNLQTLYLTGSGATDLAPVGTLTGLENLFVSGSVTQDSDTHLTLTSLAFVAPLIHLKWLDASSNLLQDLSPLAALGELEVLILTKNKVTSLAPLAGLTKLHHLDLGSNAIADASPLASLGALRVAALDHNGLTSFAGLTGHAALYSLAVANNVIADLAPVAAMPALRYLDARSNALSAVELSGHPELRTLSLDANAIAHLHLRGLPQLRSLSVVKNQLADLSGLAGLPALVNGRFTENPLGTSVAKTAGNCPQGADAPPAVAAFCHAP